MVIVRMGEFVITHWHVHTMWQYNLASIVGLLILGDTNEASRGRHLRNQAMTAKSCEQKE